VPFCLPGCLQVSKANEEQRLDQQRMLLSVNHKGFILGVNQGGLDQMVSLPAIANSAVLQLLMCL